MDHLGLVAILCQDSMIRIEGLAPPARAGSSTWADPPINQWFLNAFRTERRPRLGASPPRPKV